MRIPIFFPIGVDPVTTDAQGRFALEKLPPRGARGDPGQRLRVSDHHVSSNMHRNPRQPSAVHLAGVRVSVARPVLLRLIGVVPP